MKTTVDISDALRTVLDERAGRPAFALRDTSVTGDGLQRDVRGAVWDEVRDLAYGDRA
jgi:hypothetical protein